MYCAYNALLIDSEPCDRHTDPGLLAKPCALVHLQSRHKNIIQLPVPCTCKSSQTDMWNVKGKYCKASMFVTEYVAEELCGVPDMSAKNQTQRKLRCQPGPGAIKASRFTGQASAE